MIGADEKILGDALFAAIEALLPKHAQFALIWLPRGENAELNTITNVEQDMLQRFARIVAGAPLEAVTLQDGAHTGTS